MALLGLKGEKTRLKRGDVLCIDAANGKAYFERKGIILNIDKPNNFLGRHYLTDCMSEKEVAELAEFVANACGFSVDVTKKPDSDIYRCFFFN
jgi:hypothetical protein